MKTLTAEQVLHYHDEGFIAPVESIGPVKAAEYRRRLEQTEQTLGTIREARKGSKSHLLFRWAADLVREPAILDAVEDLIGPDILVFNLSIWPKNGNDPSFISWHQDSAYHSLEPEEQVAAWVALSDASIQAGCMEVIPRSHKLGQLPHAERVEKFNMLSKGQTISSDIDTRRRAFMPVKPGQMSMHHAYLVHSSPPNGTSERRIGISISYIPPHVKCTQDVRLSATLVRGTDRYGHFDAEPAPRADYDADARAAHADALRRYSEMRTHISY